MLTASAPRERRARPLALVALLLATAHALQPPSTRHHTPKQKFAPVDAVVAEPLAKAPARRASLKIAEDDAAPIDLFCAESGRRIACFPGAFVRLAADDAVVVIATPCDTPVAFAPSIDDDDEETWVIVQDDDPRMDAVFKRASEIVDEELDDCRMVRTALFPTLQGDLDDQFEDEDMDDLSALDDEADFDEEVLSLIATFDVEELGHAYDMMRIEQVYQLLAKKRGDEWTILDEAEADAIRPRIAEIIDDHDGDLADEIKVDS